MTENIAPEPPVEKKKPVDLTQSARKTRDYETKAFHGGIAGLLPNSGPGR